MSAIPSKIEQESQCPGCVATRTRMRLASIFLLPTAYRTLKNSHDNETLGGIFCMTPRPVPVSTQDTVSSEVLCLPYTNLKSLGSLLHLGK